MRSTRFIEILWRLHRYVYRVSGGRVGAAFGGTPVLLLITTGRRSGEPRPVTLTYFEDDRLVVIASNAGEDRHPAWWLNLQEHPDAMVQIGGSTTRMRAMEAVGEERERLWAELIRRDPAYEEYRLRVAARNRRRFRDLGLTSKKPLVLIQSAGSGPFSCEDLASV